MSDFTTTQIGTIEYHYITHFEIEPIARLLIQHKNHFLTRIKIVQCVINGATIWIEYDSVLNKLLPQMNELTKVAYFDKHIFHHYASKDYIEYMALDSSSYILTPNAL